MKKILLVTDVNFWKKGAGHRVRISALIAYLAKVSELTVAYLGLVPQIETDMINNIPAQIVILDNENILSPSGYGEKLEELLNNYSPDAVIIEYIHLSYMLNFVDEQVKMILDMHDIISDRTHEFRQFNYSGALPEMSAENEFAIMEIYDNIMVLCGPDRDKLEAVAPGKVLLCPHPVLVHEKLTRPVARKITYMASEYLPNIDAIAHFIENAWPAISAEHHVELHIFGNICNTFTPENLPPGVILRGYKQDINEIYNEADIMVNPVRFGAGMKIKTLEALASGVPLVTTTHGARGLTELAGKAFLIADGPGEFAAQIGKLIRNLSLREDLSRYARTYMSQHFETAQCFQPLLDVVNS
ncbi:MAG: glycosyltransferase family 4 protein [Bacteroidota bacterium]